MLYPNAPVADPGALDTCRMPLAGCPGCPSRMPGAYRMPCRVPETYKRANAPQFKNTRRIRTRRG